MFGNTKGSDHRLAQYLLRSREEVSKSEEMGLTIGQWTKVSNQMVLTNALIG